MCALRNTLAVATALALFAAVERPAAAEPVFEHCRLEGHGALPTVDARCARISVPMDHDDPDAGTLELHVARVPAMTATPLADPLTVIAGGPGQGASEFYAGVNAAFALVRRQREILLVDQRGTGLSRPQHCPEIPDSELEIDLDAVLPDAVRDCLEQLDADPRLFTTSVAVRDLEAVRRALGYPSLNLYGVSYGTRVAQHYARRYPQSTRSLILDAVVPPGLALGPDIALLSQHTVDRALERCASDEACAAAFPDRSGQLLHALLQRLDAEPQPLQWSDPQTGAPRSGHLTGNEVRLAVRMLAYSSEGVALLPLLLHQAGDGHFQPLKAQAEMVAGDLAGLATGMHNSVVCTEDVPFWNVTAAEREALAATFLGTLPVDVLERACGLWPRGVLDDDLREPLTGDVPVLVLSGEADPITPPSYGDTVVATLEDARHLVGPGQGHGLIAQGCVPRVVAAFLRDTDPGGLDGDCVADLAPFPFFLGPAGPGP